MPLYEDYWGDLDGYFDACRPKLKNHDHSAVDSHLKVAVRCRPLDAREKSIKNRCIVTANEGNATVSLDLTRIVQGMESATFAYDHVYGQDSSQKEVFETIGYDAVEHAFVGYNVSIFAYGQTSSGKTFSMMGIPKCEDVGLIPRICRTMFHFVDCAASDEYETYEASVEASYLEVYNEKPRDLLVDPNRSPTLQVRESPEVGVFVEGLSRHKLDTAHDAELLITSGTKYRTIASTKFNRESSRSHAVFELTLTQVFRERGSRLTMQKRSKVNLIDLAGSERTGQIGNKGVVFEEGASINKSLTVLGRCIKSLAKIKRSGVSKTSIAVPFRESVLTWYLRESLAGNAKTTMLANISPAESNGTETYGTLRYAAEAKRIETSVTMNEDPIQRQLRQQQEEITRLRSQLTELESQRLAKESASDGGGGGGGGGVDPYVVAERETLLSALEELRRSSWDAVRSSSRRFSDNAEDGTMTTAMQKQDSEERHHGGGSKLQLGANEYPLLVTLTPDPMLSGKLKYGVAKKDGSVFRIGRASSGMDLELDGVGISQEHCEITRMPSAHGTLSPSDAAADDDKGGAPPKQLATAGDDDSGAEYGGAEFALRVFADAKVHVNGKKALTTATASSGKRKHAQRRAALYNLPQDDAPEEGEKGDRRTLTPLHHGDRIILGPCRFVAIFLAFDPDAVPTPDDDEKGAAVEAGSKALLERRRRLLVGATAVGPGQQQQWEYSAVVAEMMHHVGRVPRLFGSTTDASVEGRLWEELLRGLELVHQANEIAADMCVNVEFCAALTTTLPPHFNETQMHELPSLGAHVIIHCRTALPSKDSVVLRRPTSTPKQQSPPFVAPTSADGGGGQLERPRPLARVQSRESDVDFFPHREHGVSLQRLFDVSLDAFEDFLAGLHDLYATTAVLCRALNDVETFDHDSSGSEPGSPLTPRGFGSAAASSPSPTARQRRGSSTNNNTAIPQRTHRLLKDLFKASDADGDGLITFSEVHAVMNTELGLEARVEEVKPLYDSFELTEGCMLFDEFVDLLVTHLRVKFGSTIAHLITNAKAFADYVGGMLVTNHADHEGMAVGERNHLPQRRALLVTAIASDACTEEGRRVALHALAAYGHAAPPSTPPAPTTTSCVYQFPRSLLLLLPEMELPRRSTSEGMGEEAAAERVAETGEIEAEAKHVLVVSLARLFDCPEDTILLQDDDKGDKLTEDGGTSEVATNERGATVTASVGGLADGAIGRALATLVNGDLRNDSAWRKSAADTFRESKRKDEQIHELEVLVNSLRGKLSEALRTPVTISWGDESNDGSSSAAHATVALEGSVAAAEARAAKAEVAAAEASKDRADLRLVVSALHGEGRPDGLSVTASQVWASTTAAATLLEQLRFGAKLGVGDDDHDAKSPTPSASSPSSSSPTNAVTSGSKLGGRISLRLGSMSAVEGKMKETVVALAELLDVANSRVVKALDNENKLKEAMKRLEGKVDKILTLKNTSSRHTRSTPTSPGQATTSIVVAEEHLQCLKGLVDARKQLAALAKDNSAGRLARATAQEQSVEDDLRDAAAERLAIAQRVSLAKASILADSERDALPTTPTAPLEDQLVKLEASYRAVAENEKSVLVELDRLKMRNQKLVAAIGERKETIAKGIADAESMLKAFKKQLEGELTSPGATLLIKEDDGPSVKVAALKERASIAEGSVKSILNTLSSGKWHVVPKGGAKSTWGPSAWGRNSAKPTCDRQSQPPPPPPTMSNGPSSAKEEVLNRGRREQRDDDEEERTQRNLSVQRRLGESTDLQHEASQLISQSEMRIHRIGKMVEKLDSSSGKFASLSPDHQSSRKGRQSPQYFEGDYEAGLFEAEDSD